MWDNKNQIHQKGRWDKKDQIRQEPGKLIEPSLAGGSLFDIHDSHSLSEIALKSLANSGAYLARKGAAKAIKSDYAKKKTKNVAN